MKKLIYTSIFITMILSLCHSVNAQDSTQIERVIQKKAQPPIDVLLFLKKNIRFPVEMIDKNISGKVVLQFVVNIDGSISDIKVIKTIHPAFSEEALRIMYLLVDVGKWTPAEKDGKPVATYHTLPITFRIENSTTPPK